jgi:anti-sigma factor (TIGR02949 family)
MPNEVNDIDCLTALQRLWDYLDAELTEERMAEVRHHLAICEMCLPHHDIARRFLDALQRSREERVASVTLRARVVARLTESGYTRT